MEPSIFRVAMLLTGNLVEHLSAAKVLGDL